MEDKNLQLLAGLLESLDSKSTLDEVVKSFEVVIEFVRKSHDLTERELENLRQMFVQAVDEMKSGNREHFEAQKARFKAYCESEMSKIVKISEKKIREIDEKLAEVKDGDDADEERVIAKVTENVLAKIPPVTEQLLETGDTIIDKVNTSEKKINKERVEGLGEEFERINRGISSIPRGGGKTGIQTYVNGVKKGLIQYIDIVQGSGMTVSSQLTNGLLTLTLVSSGGAGFTQLSATETPDGSRTQFTFATASAQPSFIVVDNVWQKAVTATGTVNWTWNGGTKVATLSIPAVDDIWGVAS